MKPPTLLSNNKRPLFQSPVVSSQQYSLPPPVPRRHKKKPKKQREDTAKASPRTLKPLLISPTLQPGAENAEHILATRSNYQNVMEGKAAALGIAFTTQIKSGLEVRRTAHKAAEQKRRDSLKECFERLRVEVEEGYVKRQHSLLSQLIEEQQAEQGEDGDDEKTMKPLSKVLLLQYAYEYIMSLKSTLAEKDAEIHDIVSTHRKRKRVNDDDDGSML